MRALLLTADQVLRVREDRAPTLDRPLLLLSLVLVFGMIYGAAMGTYGVACNERLLQVLYSAAKVPLLLLVTFALSLPNFYVINSLAGLREDFPAAIRALLATQAGLTIILCAFAPITLVWYVSFSGYNSAILFNAAMFLVASCTAQTMLRRFYRPLILRHHRHLWMLRLWLFIYAFVGIQMGWLLRPFVGDPSLPTSFFRADAWGNAYVVVARMVWRALF